MKAYKRWNKKTVVSAANTNNGKVGFGMTSHFPALHDTREIRGMQA